MLLVADIGGTKTKVALFEARRPLKCLKEKSYSSQAFDEFRKIIDEFLKDQNEDIIGACFGVAGPVKNQKVQATNLPWIVDAKELAKKLNLSKVDLINDLEANAWGISTLEDKDFFILNKGKYHPGNAALISAGTGLGEAGLYWNNEKHLPFASEGGHNDFAPRNELEIELYLSLKKKYGHVSYERVVSGPAISEIYEFLVNTKKAEKTFDVNSFKDPTMHISDMGLKKKDPTCIKALSWFISLYGAEAGNVALKFLAIGGVFIGGGIAPKILDLLKQDKLDGFKSFMESFVDKGRMKEILQSIPVKVVLEERAALLGCAEYALIQKKPS